MKSWTSFVPWWVWIILCFIEIVSILHWLITSRNKPFGFSRVLISCSFMLLFVIAIMDNISRGTGHLAK